MAPHNGILTPAQVATLRAVPTGHEPHAQGTAQDIAQAEAEARDARTVANVLEALKAQAEAAPPRLALPSPYVLEAFARLDAETGLALVYLPQNVATPWASYRVALATGVCVAGDYLAPYDNARALALRAFSKRLGDALGARAGVTA